MNGDAYQLSPGDRKSELTLVEKLSPDANGKAFWLCLCDCGKTAKVRADRLEYNRQKNCGHDLVDRRGRANNHLFTRR